MIVPAAGRALAVFEVFARERRELSNSELARLVKLPESSCSDLLKTLIECGYLRHAAGSRRLYPTAKLLSVAEAMRRDDDVDTVLRKRAEALRDKTSESALCGRIEAGVVRVVAFCEGRFPLRYTSTPGEKISLHVSALGKAILALQPEETAHETLRKKPLRRLGPATITDHQQLVKQLRRFRSQGYAYVENEGGDDLAALAMAGRVRDEFFAIAIAGPVGRVRLRLQKYLASIRLVARSTFEAM
jgi:DNA-binding IclR family transcriptional regulator